MTRMLGRRIMTAGLVLFTALVVTDATAGVARSETSARTKMIASARTSDFLVVLTATKGRDGGAPTARVTLRTSKRVGAGWRQTGIHRLGGAYFWHTVTGPLALCRLDIRTTAARPGFEPHAIVRLLRSPSLGCGPSIRVALGG